MRKIAALTAVALALLCGPAEAQQPLTANVLGQVQMPPQSVLGNNQSVTAGLSAIPISNLFSGLAFGGCVPGLAPTQNTPQQSLLGACGSYADNGSGVIFQLSSWADNTGTRPTVGVFGQGRALGISSRAWGANFVGYTGNTGAFVQATEIDFGVSNGISSQQAWGLALNAGGTTGTPGSNTVLGINFDSLGTGGVYSNVIRFNNAGLAQPYQNALIITGNSGGAITAPLGIDFSNASFGTAAIKTNGFTLGPTGTITQGTWQGTTVAVANGGTGDTGTAWSAFTLTPSCGTATFTVNSARSKTLGKTSWIEFDFTITAIGTCTNSLVALLPNTANSAAMLVGQEIAVNGIMAACRTTGSSAGLACAKSASANFLVNERYVLSGVYENQ